MRNLSLNSKIIFVLFVAIVGLGSVAYVGISGMEKLNSSLEFAITKSVPRIRNANRVRSNFRQLALLQANLIIEDEKEKMLSIVKDLEEKDKEFREEIENATTMSSEEARPIWVRINDSYLKWWEKSQHSQKLALADDDKAAQAVVKQMAEIRRGAESDLQTLIEKNDKFLKEEEVKAEALYADSKRLMFSASAVSLFISCLLAFIILRMVSKSIQSVIQLLTQGSTQVSVAAQQIASASEELSQAATEQAASLEETAASVEEMNSMVAKNSENAASAATTSASSQDVVRKGKLVVERMINSMEMINRSSEGMAEVVKVIEQIDKKTKVINDIVHKTELLSFNASVEAARAGEHGKGFAVVAEEVGNLARMSGLAAEEIATLLENSINRVNQMVADTKKNVETGSQVTHECGDVFEEVVKNVTSVAGMANEIASASQEQARGCSEITKAMNQLDQMTQQNAATSEECAQSAEELSAQSESLKQAVGQLVTTINGGNMPMQADINSRMATTRNELSTIVSNQNVVHLKSAKAKSKMVGGSDPIRAAANHTPSYDSDGFKDI